MTTVRRTRRWRGIVAVALFLGAVGLIGKRPLVLLTAVVAVGFSAYPRLTSTPSVDLEVERRLSEEKPGHDEDVSVSVSVRNAGDSTLPDVRIVDGVPPMLRVTDGTPRHAATLRPGQRVEFSYDVEAKHGTHRFEPATVMARDLAGATEVETEVAAETALHCTAPVPDLPVRRQTGHRMGRIVTDDGGSGIEFHRSREYRHGDPMNRIDWRRFAKTGVLTTVEYRQERAASVLVCLDVREAAYRAAGDEEPHAVAYSLAAAEQLVSALRETPDRYGFAALGRDQCWIAPSSGADHADRIRRTLDTHPALSAHPPADNGDGGDATARADQQFTDVLRRVDGDTQVLIVSPLSDGFVPERAYTLEAADHAVTVVSPDVTSTETVGQRFARVERTNRINAMRGAEIPVVDWDPEVPLGTALARARERWSA